MVFKAQKPKADLRKIQQDILKLWKENKTFEASIEQRKYEKAFRFYDGPPFVTGMPHYGTLLSSIAKDIIPRYQTMKGKRVDRVWWRDCHGIYIEQKVQKKLDIQTKDIETKIGVENFINECYKYTKANSSERNRYIDNIGRWVDVYNAYETQNNDYMESVLWVFKQLRDKGFIYEWKRVSMYSPKLATPISNFEVAMDDSYETINDPAITVAYDLSPNGEGWEHTYLLIWTTTPRTIPANMAAGVHQDIDYVKVVYQDKRYICARKRVEEVFKHIDEEEYSIIDDIKWSELVGLGYKPPYDYYYQKTGNSKDHKIYHADFATDESGTGCVHQAPEFGEVDFELAQKEGITISDAMDENGNYTQEIPDKKWIFYRDANESIIQELTDKWVLFHKASITHRVAFCPRSWVPLVYKAQKSRFVNIQKIRERLLLKNEEINRFPSHLKYGRFSNSIEQAPDRCISRTRYRGSPMPVWRSHWGDQWESETLVVGSREEIFQYNKDFKQLTKIIFVRHGRTDYNEKHWWDPEGKGKLTELGKAQANKIAEIYANHNIDYIYSSPLQRCIDTITPLAESKGLEIHQDNRITDHQNPSIQDKEFHCHLLKRSDEAIGWSWESVKDIYQRSKIFIQDIIQKHPWETVVICSHQEPIVMMRKALEDFDYNTQREKYLLDNKNLNSHTRIDYVLVEGKRLFNLHKPRVDTIKLKSPKTWKTLTRISEVLDPWMESASMPYAQLHYPFENKDIFESNFPADYVVEYTGQIRAWFYVMHVVWVALFDKPSYTNVVCTGVLQGNDGRKMSKSYGNYPDPKESFIKYGWDAIRMSLVDSPVVYGWDVAVSESNFLEATKTFILPLRNAFYFFITYANIDGWTPQNENTQRTNFLDQWIVSELNKTIQEVDLQLAQYNMQKAVQPLKTFLDNLTNRYIRRSRRRFRKSENDGDKQQAYATLYHVLTKFTQLSAPFMPFISEYIYRTLEEWNY